MLLCFSCAMLSACTGSNAEVKKSESETQIESSSDMVNEQTSMTITDYRIEAKEDTDFILGTDDQPFFISKMGMCISNGNGDYRFYRNSLYFYDYKAKVAVPLCNKPDCDHNVDVDESTCNAFFSEDMFYYDKGYSYYDENLYLLGQGSQSEHSVSLYKVSLDGASREEVCKLFEVSDFNSIGVFTIHRGFAFWSLNLEDGAQLYRMNLDDKKIERVFIVDKSAGYILRFIGAGDYLYFSYRYAEDNDMEKWNGSICRLNIYSGKTDKLVNTQSCYTVLCDKLYYFKDDKVMCSNVDGSRETELMSIPENSNLIISDSENLYLTNWDNDISSPADYKIYVYSSGGKKIDSIPISNCEFFCGVSIENIYIETTDRKLSFLNRSQIGVKNHVWETFYTLTDSGTIILN